MQSSIIEFEPSREKKSRFVYMAGLIFNCLPATSHTEIRKRLANKYDEHVTNAYVSTMLTNIRKHCYDLGFTVPHSKRGQRPDGEEEGYRFQAVLVDHGKAPWMDPGGQQTILAGLESTVRTSKSLDQNEGVAMFIASNLVENPSVKRSWRRYARLLKAAAEEAEELLGEING